MKQKTIITTALLLATLLCKASPMTPDSISVRKADTFKQEVSLCEEALKDPAIANNSQQQMELLKRLMDINDILQMDHRLMYYIDRLRDAAIKNKDNAYLAMAEFMMGKRLHYHGDTIRGYQLCRKAIGLMKVSSYQGKQSELCSFYAEILKMYMRDGRYDDAMRMSIFQEEAATSPSGFGSHQVQEAALQQMNAQRRINALRRMWALRTILMAKAGKMEQADDCYEHWQQLEGDSPIDDMEILDYLILSQHHQEAHDVIHRYREFLRTESDTINFRMINILSKDALLHAMSNDLEVSTLNSELINEIADSLHLHHSKGAMSNTYNLIMEEKHAHRQKIAIIALVSSILVLILMGAAILYLSNKVRQRNKKLLRVLNALEAYRNIMAEQTEQSVQKPSKVKALEEEQRMFVEIDARVTNERPFTDPDFDHESLIRFSGIDEELFVRMMARYTHALNSLSYINSRRAEYGARLIIEHPHENIDAIAKACGFKGTDAFNRAFKFALGVTPSEYRNSMVKMFKDEQ